MGNPTNSLHPHNFCSLQFKTPRNEQKEGLGRNCCSLPPPVPEQHECLLHNSPLSPGDNTASFVQNVTTLSGLEGYNLHHFEPFRGWVQAWGCRSTWLWGSYKITIVQGTRTGRNAVAEAVPAEPASGDGKVWQGSSRKPLGTQGFTPS